MFHKQPHKQTTTLADYYEVKMERIPEEPKKLTFEDWLSHRFPAGFENWDGNLGIDDLLASWNASRENS